MRRFVFVVIAVVSLTMIGVAAAGPGGNKTGQACYKGAYANYMDPTTGQAFAGQDACVAYFARVGTLVDASVGFIQPSSAHDGFSASGDITAHNGGTVTETVTVAIHVLVGPGVFSWNDLYCAHPDLTPDGYYQTTCTASLAPGQTVWLFGFGLLEGSLASGSASITGATYSDPNMSNNTVNISLSG